MFGVVAMIDFGRIHRHWAVKEHGQVGNCALLLQFVDQMQQQLCTPHRERWNHDHSATVCGARDRLAEHGLCVRCRFV